MTLYSYRSTGYITKFDSDGNVEASYQVSSEGCTCPAGHRHTCRHRQMLPDLRPLADTHWFWDFDRKQAVDLFGTSKETLDAIIASVVEQTVDEDTSLPEQTVRIAPSTKHWRRL